MQKTCGNEVAPDVLPEDTNPCRTKHGSLTGSLSFANGEMRQVGWYKGVLYHYYSGRWLRADLSHQQRDDILSTVVLYHVLKDSRRGIFKPSLIPHNARDA
ncbi:MAG: hypothetical protein WCG07_03035, partial [Candidatus Taylorbacteria bacterium]